MDDNIECFVKDRGIKYLCHFTPRSNLGKIKSEGLKLRDASQMTVTDTSRYDMSKNICLTISEPNSWMFKKKQEQGFDLVLLILSPSVLYDKECLFFPYNAATKSFRGLDKSYLSSREALGHIFSDKITFKKSQEEERTIHRNIHAASFMPTSNQAEVQVTESIDPSYIIAIIESDIPLAYNEINKKASDLIARKIIHNSISLIDFKENSISKPEDITPHNDSKSQKTNPEVEAIIANIERIFEPTIKVKDIVENKEEKKLESINYKNSKAFKKTTPQKVVSTETNGSNSGCLIIFVVALLIYLFSR